MKQYSILVLFLALLTLTTPIANAASKNRHPLISDSSSSNPTDPSTLSNTEAVRRAKQVHRIHYQLSLNLDSTQPFFHGKTILQFNLKPNAAKISDTLFVDFEDGKIESMQINGTPVENLQSSNRYDGHRIYFKLSELKPTASNPTNTIEIQYTHAYSNSGSGLHRFQDPADGKVYLYSNFEPDHAHFLFPCFDQPDLKAAYTLTAEVPSDWEVISNALEKSKESSNNPSKTATGNFTTWTFPKSPLFSTYLFAIHAGPYKSWKSEASTDAENIPLRLFARQSLAKYVDHQEWFNVTRAGLQFYGNYFGIPYPFKKYDQLIVPEFNAGAMENIGAVTFSERFVHRTKVTEDVHRRRADVILHEMAHMWFGDLVTMKWWNGLWLNESFATFMSSKALAEATQYKDVWQAFSQLKFGAYREDQLVTTHPIEVSIPDTHHALTIFDGITYNKGAATLRQLNYYLGEEDFREGLQRYFPAHAYRNTTLKDLIYSLSEASGKSLARWEKDWLQTAGVNSVRADWACEMDPKTQKNKISKFDLIQSPATPIPGATSTLGGLRPHRMDIGLYYTHSRTPSKHLEKNKIIDAIYESESTSVENAIGLPCPDFILLNHSDHDYVKTEINLSNLKKVETQISQLHDPLTRQMFLQNLWSMVIDGKLKPQTYADVVLNTMGAEKNALLLSQALQTLTNPRANVTSVLKFLDAKTRPSYQHRIEKWVRQNLRTAPAGSDLQLVWYQAFLRAASDAESVQLAHDLLMGRQKLSRLPIDQERRWDLIQVLARAGTPGTPVANKSNIPQLEELILTELGKDFTDMGQRAAIAAEVMIPDSTLKQQWLDQILRKQHSLTPVTQAILKKLPGHEQLPFNKIRDAMDASQLLDQPQFIETSIDSYFQNAVLLGTSLKPEDDEYAKAFSRAMFPSLCHSSTIDKTNDILNAHPNLSPIVSKSLRIHRQEEERCVRARTLVRSP